MRGRIEEAALLSRREVLWQSLRLAGLPPLCCATPEVPPGDVRFEGALIVVDLDWMPRRRRQRPDPSCRSAAKEACDARQDRGGGAPLAP